VYGADQHAARARPWRRAVVPFHSEKLVWTVYRLLAARIVPTI
jgi:hypothetical protein